MIFANKEKNSAPIFITPSRYLNVYLQLSIGNVIKCRQNLQYIVHRSVARCFISDGLKYVSNK